MISENVQETKIQLRKNCIRKRNSIAPPYYLAASERICKCVYLESKYIRAKDILCYSAFGNEVSTRALIDKAYADGKNVYFPRVEGDEMNFYRVYSLEDMKDGYKGIREPFYLDNKYNNTSGAICIVPGVVFGRDGYRIGYGKGFYDRYLSRFPGLYKIGICFEVQLVDSVPIGPYDVQMDEIICENYIFNKDGKGEARWI